MNTLTAVSLLLTLGACYSAVVQPVYSGDKFELLILHNNDMHAKFEQTSQRSGACTVQDREAGKCYGGFPRVAHVVKEARRKAQTGEGPPVLYLNAGDTYTGTAWFTIYKWRIAAEFINALQPDAVSLGNNEVEKGSEEIPELLKNIDTKILATNVILKTAKDNERFQKSIIFNMNGVHVGVVSYLTPNVLDESDDIEYINEVIALKEEVEKLKANVNIIIALGHSTSEVDAEIAKEVDGLDLVIAGQRNQFYWDGTTKSYATNDKPQIVIQASGKQVPIVHSSSYNTYLGSLQIAFDSEGQIIEYNSKPILLDETVPQDEEAMEIVRSHYSELSARSEVVVGRTAVVLDGSNCRTAECNLGNLIADAINYQRAVSHDGALIWTDAAVTIIPSGAIAGSIAPTNRPADVTRGDIWAVLPEESSLVAITMTGTVLNQVLEHSVATYNAANPTGQLLQWSGVRATYDMSRPSGSRLVDAVVRCNSCYVPEFYVIDTWRTYKVIMPASLADGEYGYTMFAGLEREVLNMDEVTSTIDYLAVRSPVYPEIADRIVLRNVEQAEDEVEAEESEEVEVEVEQTEDSADPLKSSTLVVLGLLPILMYFRNN